jgi:hypothetical protein
MNFNTLQKLLLLLFCFVCATKVSFAQSAFSVSPLSSAIQIESMLEGPGAKISNVTITGNTQAIGSFTSTDPILNINGGLLLTTGNAQTISGVAYGANATANATAKGRMGKKVTDVSLLSLIGSYTQLPSKLPLYDAYILEFDVIPSSGKLELKYKFASDEYPLYNCTDFTDVMAIEITDAALNVVAVTNFVQTTSSSKVVAVNNINSGALVLGQAYKCGAPYSGLPGNASIYQDNSNSQSVSYNGITQLLTASALVSPCSTYHVKIVVADVGDDDRDSGCFLVEKGVSSTEASITSIAACNQLLQVTGFYLMEGCNTTSQAIVTVAASSSAATSTYSLTMAGVGANPLSASDVLISAPITIAPGATGTFTITAIDDFLPTGLPAELPELGLFSLVSSTCPNAPPIESFELKVFDKPKLERIATEIGICSGSIANYKYKLYVAGLNDVNFNQFNFTILPLTTPASASVAVQSTISAKFSFWPSSSATYTVSSIGLGGCTTLPSLPLTITLPSGTTSLTCSASTNGLVSCNSPNSGTINVTASGGTTTTPYSLYTCIGAQGTLTNTVNSFTGLAVGTYTIVVTDASFCTATTAITLAYNMPQINSCSDQTICLGSSYTLQASVSPLSATGTVSWLIPATGTSATSATSVIQGTVVNPIANTTYTVLVTDGVCSISCTKPISVITSANFTASVMQCTSATPSIEISTTNTIVVECIGIGVTTTSNLGPFVAQTLNGLTSGNYTLQAKADGCTTTKYINLPAQFSAGPISITHPPCMGAAGGQFNTSNAGGVPPYNLTLLPISTASISVSGSNATVSNLAAGTYTATISDAAGCTITASLTLTQPTVLLSLTATDATCPNRANGGRDGKIVASFVKDSTPTSVQWKYGASANVHSTPSSSSSSSYTVPDLGIGQYIITAIDGPCEYNTTTTLNSNIVCKLNTLQITPSLCGSSKYDVILTGYELTEPNSVLTSPTPPNNILIIGANNCSGILNQNNCKREIFDQKLRYVGNCEPTGVFGSYYSWVNQLSFGGGGSTYTLTPAIPTLSGSLDGNQCFTNMISVPQADAMPAHSFKSSSFCGASSAQQLTMHNPVIAYQPTPSSTTYTFPSSLSILSSTNLMTTTTPIFNPWTTPNQFTGSTQIVAAFTPNSTYSITATTGTAASTCTYTFKAPKPLGTEISNAIISVGNPAPVSCKHQVTSVRVELPLSYFYDLDYDCYLEVMTPSGTFQRASRLINSSYAINTKDYWKEGYNRPTTAGVASHEFLYVTPGTYRVAFTTKCKPWEVTNGYLNGTSPCSSGAGGTGASSNPLQCFTTNSTVTILPPTSCP